MPSDIENVRPNRTKPAARDAIKLLTAGGEGKFRSIFILDSSIFVYANRQL